MLLSVDGLLALATQLLNARTSAQVLDLTCREVGRLAGVDLIFGSLSESATWTAGVHHQVRGLERTDATPAQRSALFAVHRAVSRERGPLTLQRPAYTTALDALCGKDAQSSLVAIPIIQRRGGLCGCFALCVKVPLSDDVMHAVTELARLAAAAFENVQRIAFAQRHRERLNLLAEAAEEALWDWSPDTGEFWWGGGVQTLMGDVLIQSRLSWKFEQVHPEDADRVRRSFERVLTAADTVMWREEYRQRRSDGTWILVEDQAHILRDSSGRAHRVVGAMRDVTELRGLLTREQTARAEAERASLAKDQFLAMLGHELRNPLSPILSAVQLLRKRAGPELSEKAMTIIERQARHLTRLVDDLLDVARIVNGKVLLQPARLDLADVIEAALETTTPLLVDRRHVVEARISRDLHVDADRARMEQVIVNLLTNAAKYTPPGGRISVRAHVANEFVEVRVADNGIGVSAEMLPKIFETFAQDAQALDRRQGGLGLGLSIVRNLVKLHGGTVEAISSGEGHGSEFVVRVPTASSASVVDLPAIPAALVSGVTRRVLVVDDNYDAAEFLAAGLAGMGHETRVVHDGETALSAVAEFDPDVVMLDLGLPMIDGYEVARRLRERYGSERPRLVAVTGYGQESDLRKTREAGFDEHLVKPVLFERLQEAVLGATTTPVWGGDADSASTKGR